ncbi:hypothetical protein GCM10027440_08110 [Nocardiopsis coralliicola]
MPSSSPALAASDPPHATEPASAQRTPPPASPSATRVVLLADLPPTGLLGDDRADRFPIDSSEPEDPFRAFGPFVEFAGARTGAGGKIVALYPAWREEAASRCIRFARARGLTDDIAAVGLGLGPLALSFLADQLTYLARFLPPGAVAAMARELPHHLLSGACLSSVAGLAALPVTTAQHFGSYLPRRAFLGLCSPAQEVITVEPGELAEVLPPLPGTPVQVVWSAPDGAGDTFTEDLLPVLRAHATRDVPPQPLAAEYWGTPRATEFVAYSAHPQALTYAARSVRTVECRWCNEAVAEPQCPFCGSTAHTAPGRRPPLGGPPSIRAVGTPSVRTDLPRAAPLLPDADPFADELVPAWASAPAPAVIAESADSGGTRSPGEAAVPPPALEWAPEAPALAQDSGPPFPQREPSDDPPPPRPLIPRPRPPTPFAPAVPAAAAQPWQEPPVGLPIAPNGRRAAHPIPVPDDA